jgi:hypothetical protein
MNALLEISRAVNQAWMASPRFAIGVVFCALLLVTVASLTWILLADQWRRSHRRRAGRT